MIRIYYTGRRPDTIPAEVRPYCKFENGRLALPSLSELSKYRIVVVTLSTSRVLSLMGLPRGHFSHIFVDEAAQALEPETLIPLVLAGERTKVILAGDHMQMDPPCYSSIARKYGLHVSLLERLFDHEAYSSGVGQLCKTLLTENHRSHTHIMEIPSKLFYKNKLTCRAKFPTTGPKNLPPLKFIGVDGQEAQDEDSPSYYNNHEALKVTEQVKLLVSQGLDQQEICVLSYYQKQVTRIRHLLRNERLGQVAVFRVDDVQGKEFRALLLSTVRTCYARDDDDLEEDAGFLTNPKLFNTAVTRAKEWLVVCGEPVTLCTVGSNRLCWVELIKKCHRDLDSFEYPNAAQFEALLQTKLFTRKILEKKNKQFFQNMRKVQTPPIPQQQAPPPPPPPPAVSMASPVPAPATTPPTTGPRSVGSSC
jgi:superfamily I DNA and/or RNA helicase